MSHDGFAGRARGRIVARLVVFAVVATLASVAPAGASTVVATPGAPGGWALLTYDPATGDSAAPTTRGTSTTFADGPAPPAAGLGSIRQVLGDPGESSRLQGSHLAGVRVGDVDALAYSTWVSGGGAATLVQLLVDLDGDGRYATATDDILTFDPIYQTGGARGDPVPNQCPGVVGCVAARTWQRWNAAVGGWWSQRAGTYGPPVVTLDSYQAANPNARVAADVAALRLVAGGGGTAWRSYDGRIDRVLVAGVEYDFEPRHLLADCSAATDDVALLQARIDAALAGYAVRVRGTCDLSAASPHGGTASSIDAAAVVVGSSSPKSNVVIESDGVPGSAVLVGSGTQAALFVPPGATGVTIRGLTFSNLGRAIVAMNASGLTLGSAGGVAPDPAGNVITGGAGMSAAILAVATDAPSVPIAYGVAGASTKTYPVPAGPTTNLTVSGNRIAYDAAGIPTSERHLVAIDVRQAGSATIDGVTVARNAAWFATGELRSFDVNAVRVQSTAPAVRIANVRIEDNTLGRPEDAGAPSPSSASAGRAGIVVHRVAGAVVARNRVRSRMTATPVSVPGGGIVAAETSDTSIEDNEVIAVVEEAAAPADLGAVGVLDDLGALRGDPAPSPPPSTRVTLLRNRIGSDGFGAHRGMVVNGSSWVDASGNDVRYSSGPALSVAIDVAGAAPAARAVAASVLCGNVLDGVADDPNEVAFGEPFAVTASNVPGGGLHATNQECLDADIGFVESGGSTNPSEAGAVDEYTVALTRRPRASVVVSIEAGSQASASPATLTFTPDDWAVPQSVVVSAVQDAVSEGTHLQSITHRATSADALYDGMLRTVIAMIGDDDPGAVLVVESGGSTAVAEGGATDTYTVVLASRPAADVQIFAGGGSQLFASPSQIVFTPADWAAPRTVTVGAVNDTLREGPHLGSIGHAVRSADPNFDRVPVAGIVATIVDNDVPAAPVIAVPLAGSRIRSTSLVVSGTAEGHATLQITEAGSPIATLTVPAHGKWSTAPLAFAEGPHTISATVTDRNGFRSAATTRSFVVDLTVPAPPVILEPEEGRTYFEATLTVRGTAEPNATVVVAEGASRRSATVDAAGSWTMRILYAAGPHEIIATVLDGAGNEGPSSPPRRFIVNADGIPPDPPVIETPPEGAIVPLERTGPGGTTEPGFAMTGRAEPSARVEIWEGGLPVAQGVADSAGVFSIEILVPEARTWRLQARAIDQSNNRGQFSAPRTVHVDGSPPTVAVRRPSGQVLVGIVPPGEAVTAFGSASDDTAVVRVTVTYTDLFGRSTIRVASLCCEESGTWRWEDRASLLPGQYDVTAVAIDAAGNASRRSAVMRMVRL